jgi:hypothetical protein
MIAMSPSSNLVGVVLETLPVLERIRNHEEQRGKGKRPQVKRGGWSGELKETNRREPRCPRYRNKTEESIGYQQGTDNTKTFCLFKGERRANYGKLAKKKRKATVETDGQDAPRNKENKKEGIRSRELRAGKACRDEKGNRSKQEKGSHKNHQKKRNFR